MKEITFWQSPNARRYERLIRDSINHVGRQQAFNTIDTDFFSRIGGCFVTLEHQNLDVQMSIHDDILRIIEWSQAPDEKGLFQIMDKKQYVLSDYPCTKALAIHLFHTHTQTNKG